MKPNVIILRANTEFTIGRGGCRDDGVHEYTTDTTGPCNESEALS